LESPCINICQLDDATGICEGCGRSGDEIAGWIGYTPSERRAIMSTLAERLKQPPEPLGSSK
jgi:uncharacterized protein